MPVRRAVRRGMRRTARRTSRRMIRRRAVVGGMVTVGLASGSMAKMSQADAQKVEQETGKKLEDMSEEELEIFGQLTLKLPPPFLTPDLNGR